MSLDTDAQAYIDAVETADGQAATSTLKKAVNAFVVGCKSDGIWAAIKASCLLAGPRTLAGALVPLVGPAPTDVGGNFVAGDYDPLTGLKGDGSTKYLDTNRNNNADPQDDNHNAVWVSQAPTTGVTCMGIGDFATPGSNNLLSSASAHSIRARNQSQFLLSDSLAAFGFYGFSRSSSSSVQSRSLGSTSNFTQSSQSPAPGNLLMFARIIGGQASDISNPRIAFYSIGESLDLVLLNVRLSQYKADLLASTLTPRRRRQFAGYGL